MTSFTRLAAAAALAFAVGAPRAVAQTPAPAPATSTNAAPAKPIDRLVALAAGSPAEVQLDILRGIRAALQGRRTAPMPAGWETLEGRLAGSPDAELRTLARTLGLTFGSDASQTAFKSLITDKAAPAAERRNALEALLAVHNPDLGPSLRTALNDPDLREIALRGLAAYNDAETPPAILGVYAALPANERRDALNTLASRAAYAKPLMAAVADGRVPKADLTAEVVRQLRQLKDAEVTAKLTEVWGVVQETSPDMKAAVDKYTRIYWAGGSTPGNAPKGRAVFNRVCAQCHHLYDFGGRVGPDITGANRGDLDYLLQNILFPNAVIPNEYRAASLELKDGRVVIGIIKSKDGAAYSVQTANELLSLQKSDVDKVEQSDISMMPEGLLANMPDQDVRDLLYYLSRPGQVPLPPP
jgi:putative heme-binding domain-containing protein